MSQISRCEPLGTKIDTSNSLQPVAAGNGNSRDRPTHALTKVPELNAQRSERTGRMVIAAQTVSKDDRPQEMARNVKQAPELLTVIAHETRLMLLGSLADGETSVGQLVAQLSLDQPAVSQQLARLRTQGIVVSRRDGKSIYDEVADDRALVLIARVYDVLRELKRIARR